MKHEFREQPDLTRLLPALARHHIRYILFGTVGLIAYGVETTTGDLDICIAPDEENLERLADLLRVLEARPRYIPGFSNKEECERWKPVPLLPETFDSLFQTKFGDLDIVPNPYGPHGKEDRFTFARLDERAVTKAAYGCHIRVADFDDLLASKLSAHREKDMRLTPEIERLQALRARGEQTGWPIATST